MRARRSERSFALERLPVRLLLQRLPGVRALPWPRGLGRPNPFFDDHTNAPISAPRVLTPTERAAL